MEDFDVIIIGAGPSGCQCARSLSKKGFKVMLAERFDSFKKNNFSSAGAPIDFIKEFDIDKKVVSSFWDSIKIVTSKQERFWKSKKTLGVVMDFAKLKEFLAKEAQLHGCKVKRGYEFIGCKINNSASDIILKRKKDKKIEEYKTKIVVDATGPARSVISRFKKNRKLVYAVGLEYLIKIKKNIPQNVLYFFLGRKWAPDGYGWIFSMKKGVYKVGIGCIKKDKTLNLKRLIHQIISKYIKIKEYEIIDIHGGVLKYQPKQNDNYYYKNIIAIGDAISAVNPLGGEGIRHGMRTANIASEHIISMLNSEIDNFNMYEKEIKEYYSGQNYRKCVILSKLVYLHMDDKMIEKGVSYISKLDVNRLMDILYNYKFGKIKLQKKLKVLIHYFLKKYFKKVDSKPLEENLNS